MTTYYRDPDVLITSSGIRMNGQEFRLSELIQIWHTRSGRSWSIIAKRGALGLAILTPLLAGALAVGVALLIHTDLAHSVALAIGGVLLGLAVLPVADLMLERVDRSYDAGTRTLEIWGRLRTGDVLLLRTTDAQRFGRVYRALLRALEPAARR